ncbi:unnamed protein product [Dibothriocephalus latus]|uniref:Uncharacterized protein n=1 Tax=Dibothriocephalus latus TaxID=60516 RepID=A0A3P7NB75_DIBLA|nr:unnamed protein product [Dibothriocephalus latus]
MESLGYVLMYFLRGSLPWQGLKAGTKRQKYERISEKKMETSIESLCAGYPGQCSLYLFCWLVGSDCVAFVVVPPMVVWSTQ